jgi:site-specific DNA-methyltransferase (adenine-specific)
MIDLKNIDCMDYMATLPDKAFELAIVDPPYGIGISRNPVRQSHDKKQWDDAIPNQEYFGELFRVSKNQIIWGGNYFKLPASQGFIIWDKVQPENFSLAMCEYAWSSIQSPAKIFKQSVLLENGKIHPTQKPVALYKWLLSRYTKPGDRILDTHGGSMSSAIACGQMNFDITLCELDLDYFTSGCQRVLDYFRAQNLFAPQPEIKINGTNAE